MSSWLQVWTFDVATSRYGVSFGVDGADLKALKRENLE